MEALVLWDIDRTLVNMAGIGRDFFRAALRSVAGRELEQMPDMGGKTDHELANSLLAMYGFEVRDELLQSFFEAMAVAAAGLEHEMRGKGRALDGARAALDALASSPGVVQSVVTGNIPTIARMKLASCGLDQQIDFEVGGYGSESADRAALVRLAGERAQAKYEHRLDRTQVVVLGDTPHDIAGAKANGVSSVGVATGSSSASELEAAGADVVLPSLADTNAVVDAIHRLTTRR